MNPTAIALADLNGDGKADVILANYYSSKYHYHAAWQWRQHICCGVINHATGRLWRAGTCRTGDWNGDGIQDVVTANTNDNNSLTVVTSATRTEKTTASASGISPIGQGSQHAVTRAMPVIASTPPAPQARRRLRQKVGRATRYFEPVACEYLHGTNPDGYDRCQRWESKPDPYRYGYAH